MELTFVCTGKKSVSTESVEYFLNMGFVLLSKYMMTMTSIMSAKMSFINL